MRALCALLNEEDGSAGARAWVCACATSLHRDRFPGPCSTYHPISRCPRSLPASHFPAIAVVYPAACQEVTKQRGLRTRNDVKNRTVSKRTSKGGTYRRKTGADGGTRAIRLGIGTRMMMRRARSSPSSQQPGYKGDAAAVRWQSEAIPNLHMNGVQATSRNCWSH